MKRTLLQTITLAIFTVSIAACGGPKYSSSFSDWFKISIAEEMPVKINEVDIEETASSDGEAIFQFNATAEVVEELYAFTLYDYESLGREITEKGEGITNESIMSTDLEKLIGQFPKKASEYITTYEVVTEKGKEVSLKGKARAKLGKNGWEFSILETTYEDIPGSKKPNIGRLYLKGSKEEKEAVENMKKLVAKIHGEFERARKMDEEKFKNQIAEAERQIAERKAAELKKAEDLRIANETEAKEKEARRKTMFAKFPSGKVFTATWQGAENRGSLGLRIGKGVELPDGFSMEAVLFIPEKTEYSKNISAMIIGDGSEKSPFVLELRAATHESTVRYNRHRDDSGIGFVAGDAKFILPLNIDHESLSLNGTLKRAGGGSGRYYGPIGPVDFVFTPSETDEKKSVIPKE